MYPSFFSNVSENETVEGKANVAAREKD